MVITVENFNVLQLSSLVARFFSSIPIPTSAQFILSEMSTCAAE